MLLKLYPCVRPLLFSMDAEAAHHKTLRALNKAATGGVSRRLLSGTALPDVPTTIMGLTLKNPVGLAAGLDKDGAYIDGLGLLGFGFMEIGTVTPLPQAGNPQPRLFRLPRAQALINRMGFNNQGLDAFVANVKASQWHQQGGVLGLNIGKNASTSNAKAIDDYLKGLAAVYPYADYVTVNISSPNTENLRELQHEEALSYLLAQLQARRRELADAHGREVPLAVKIAPDLSFGQIDRIAEVVSAHQLDGVIATNTTLSRNTVQGLPHAREAGGLSGLPVHALSLQVIRRLRKSLAPEIAIIGVGGIMNAQQAREKILAGANAIQLYTGLIYKGPQLVRDCVHALAK